MIWVLQPPTPLHAARAPQGVVTHSSGNHGQAVALAAQLNGVTAHVVVPRTTPQCKIDAIEGYGGVCAQSDLAHLDSAPSDESPLLLSSQGVRDTPSAAAMRNVRVFADRCYHVTARIIQLRVTRCL